MGRNVPGDHRAGANHRPRPHSALRDHGGTDSDQRALSEGNVAAQVNARCDVDVIPDAVVVIHGAAGVEDDVLAP